MIKRIVELLLLVCIGAIFALFTWGHGYAQGSGDTFLDVTKECANNNFYANKGVIIKCDIMRGKAHGLTLSNG